jgi:hypothetical protein
MLIAEAKKKCLWLRDNMLNGIEAAEWRNWAPWKTICFGGWCSGSECSVVMLTCKGFLLQFVRGRRQTISCRRCGERHQSRLIDFPSELRATCARPPIWRTSDGRECLFVSLFLFYSISSSAGCGLVCSIFFLSGGLVVGAGQNALCVSRSASLVSDREPGFASHHACWVWSLISLIHRSPLN